MTTESTNLLLSWENVERLPELQRLKLVLDTLPSEKVIAFRTVYRYQRCYRENGVSGLSHQRGARGGYKLKGEKLLEAQRLLDQGESARATARAIGVSRAESPARTRTQ